jgi:hypothetical protein
MSKSVALNSERLSTCLEQEIRQNGIVVFRSVIPVWQYAHVSAENGKRKTVFSYPFAHLANPIIEERLKIMGTKLALRVETQWDEISEWIEAFDQLVDEEGTGRAAELVDALSLRAEEAGVHRPIPLNTPFVNTIPAAEEVPYPGDRQLERRIKSLVRWNAMAMVHRQNKKDAGIGGHISTYSSLATLW